MLLGSSRLPPETRLGTVQALAETVLVAPLPETVQRVVAGDRCLPGLTKQVAARLHERPVLLERGTLPCRLRAGCARGSETNYPFM